MQIAIAIEMRAWYEAQRVEAYYLNALLNVAENLAEQESLDDALDTIVTLTTLLVGVKRAAIFLFDPTTLEFVAAKAYGLTPAMQRRFERLRFSVLDPARNMFAELWKSRESVAIENAQASDLVQLNLATLFESESVLLFPLIAPARWSARLAWIRAIRRIILAKKNAGAAWDCKPGGGGGGTFANLICRRNKSSGWIMNWDWRGKFRPHFCLPNRLRFPAMKLRRHGARAREVGGDFYDLIPLQNHRIGLVIADVSDKGLPASLFMALTRTIIRTMAIGKPSARGALERANDVIIADAQSDMFVTAFYGVLDPESGVVTYVNGGHNPPLVYHHATKTIESLKEHGIVGILPNIEPASGTGHFGMWRCNLFCTRME